MTGVQPCALPISRLPQLRATNSGLSALILPTGEMQATTGFGSRAAFRVDVPRPPRSRTLVVAWGDWLGPASLIGLAALLAWIGLRRRDAASPDDVVPSPE